MENTTKANLAAPLVRGQTDQDLSAHIGPEASHELLGVLYPVHRVNGRALILVNGGGAFGVQFAEYLGRVTVVHPNPKVGSLAKAKQVSSGSAVHRYLADEIRPPLYSLRHPIKPGIRYITAPLDRTGLKAESFDFILLEQSHYGNRSAILNEARRLLMPGGEIVSLSYFSGLVVPRKTPAKDVDDCDSINALVADFHIGTLTPLMTSDERERLYAFRQGNETSQWDSGFRDRAVMRATWSLVEFVEHIKGWPVVRRMEMTTHVVDVWAFVEAVKKRWGSAKRRRVTNWPVLIEREMAPGRGGAR